MRLTRFDFPEGFLFGVATATPRIEASGFGGCGSCHWDTFAATPGKVVRALHHVLLAHGAAVDFNSLERTPKSSYHARHGHLLATTEVPK